MNNAYVQAQAHQVVIVAAIYAVGAATFAASFSNVQYANLGAAFHNDKAIFNNVDVGFQYQFAPAFTTGIA
ncbi:putative porin [Paraburkholderia youngii]|uniref:hypothetical protein n=1 Tax=Paraburkholderia youngii TaxID=2782701 RepID=UPI003D1A8183